MQDYKIIFYLLTSFIVFGGNLFDRDNFSLSGLCFNLALLIPFIIMKVKIEAASYYLNKQYELDDLKNMLKNNGNLTEKELRKYVKKIDLINDIDEDGVDMVINQLTQFATESGSKRELELILKRINVDYMKNNFELFDLDIDKNKFKTIINETLKNITN
jgi:hypothetical protein